MVVKPYGIKELASDRFESRVILDGSQTNALPFRAYALV